MAPTRSIRLDPALKDRLDSLYHGFNAPDSALDPIQIVRRFERTDDREVVGFIAAALAFGRLASVMQSIETVVAVAGPRPADYVRAFAPHRDRVALAGFVHRWIREADVVALFWLLRQMLERAGSLEAFFADGDDPSSADVEPGLERFAERAMALDLDAAYGRVRPKPGVGYFFSRPSTGGACKRMNLFLRWMVRRDAHDLGVWPRVSPSRLVVPLDTHIIRVSQCLRLTRYTSPGWRMARDITASLRRLDPDDPVKYDFAMCHMAMNRACGYGAKDGDHACPLKGVCRPAGRRA